MAEIINLRMARKARARNEAATQAQTNRAKHGQTKAQKQSAKREQDRLDRAVDGAKLERPED
jgi:hypothetical protein